jgi:hypothetical protein
MYFSVKVKVKLFLRFLTDKDAMEAYWGSGGIPHSFFDLGTRWR